MADKNNPQPTSTSQPKSTLIKKKDVDYTKIINIGRIQQPKEFVEQERNRLNQIYKTQIEQNKISPQQIEQLVQNTIVQRNVIEGVKVYLREFYELKSDDSEKNEIKEALKKQRGDTDDATLTNAADNVIYESLLMKLLGEEWKVSVSDQEVDQVLEERYKVTNEPIRDIKNDKNKYENIRLQILNNKVINEIGYRFHVTAEIDLTPGKRPESQEKPS